MNEEVDYRKMALDGVVRLADGQVQWMLDDNPEWGLDYAVDAWSQPYLENSRERRHMAGDIVSDEFGHYWMCEQDIELFNKYQKLCNILEENVHQLFRDMENGSKKVYEAILAYRSIYTDEALRV